MASLDLFRVFVAVYRAGSVSAAARERHLTQPAVSAHLSTLEARVGEALFTRTPKGVVPTERGKLLYAQVAESVDRLENAGRNLRPNARAGHVPLRVGCPAEFLQGFVLPRLARWNDPWSDTAVDGRRPGSLPVQGGAGEGQGGSGQPATDSVAGPGKAGQSSSPSPSSPLLVQFGEPRTLAAQVEAGTLDAALLSAPAGSRALAERDVAAVPYVLIGPAAWPGLPRETSALGETLNGRPWVSYSLELPITRRFFTQVLGQKFTAPLALVVPDLRAVVSAVEYGLGASLTPLYAAQEALQAARVQELYPVRSLIPPEYWRLVYRPADEDREELHVLARRLQGTPVP